MKRIILTLVAVVGLLITATAQQPAADLRKSALSSPKSDNSLSVYKDGQVLYATDGKLNLTKESGKDFAQPTSTKEVSYSGERETYAYDSKTQTLYAVVRKKDQKMIKNGDFHVAPAATETVTAGKATTLKYWNWQFGESAKTTVAAYSAKDPSLSSDGNRLYFSSTAEGGYGGYDIWYLNRNADGTWSAPVNAGNTVNSPGNEEYPFLYDGILLFSSDRGGNYDLYATV
ncbi:MAG: hypothetical protein LBP85_07590, partial [Prevotellaceae bacterium]|nr:hypothetical protein [Prevotellaceae bacterium]